MKVKSFVSGMADGVEGAMKYLDEEVAGLGNVRIHDLTDTFYSEKEILGTGPRIVRVVVYEPCP